LQRKKNYGTGTRTNSKHQDYQPLLITQTEQDDPLLPHHPHKPNPPHHNNQIRKEIRTIKEENTHNREISSLLPLHPPHHKPLSRTTTGETGIPKAWDAI
jgi:hypothetical protein